MPGLIIDIETNGFIADLNKVHCVAYQDEEGGPIKSVGGRTDEQIRALIAKGRGMMPAFTQLSDGEITSIINFINDKVNAASDTYDIKNNVKHAEATVTMKESGINSFREQGETSKFVKKYEIIEELKIENVFGMFFRDRNLWKNMSKKTQQ